MRKVVFAILIFSCFLSCAPNENQILGAYAAVGYINTRDTIKLNKKGVYERLVYDKNNKLSLHMEGNWKYKDGLLVMRSFFLNLDRDITSFPELLTDTVMRMETVIERTGGKLKFCTGYVQNVNCYQSIIK